MFAPDRTRSSLGVPKGVFSKAVIMMLTYSCIVGGCADLLVYAGDHVAALKELSSTALNIGSNAILKRTQPANAVTTNSAAMFPGSSEINAAGGILSENASEPLGPSSRRTCLAISEIMYKPALRTDGKVVEYVEVYNSNPYFEDISGYQLAGQVSFSFPPGTILRGGGFAVVASVPGDVETVYGLTNVFGPFFGSLSPQKGGGFVSLLDAIGSVLLEIPYQKGTPWPVAANGTGHSLVLARPSYGESDPRAWSISEVVGGSPGKVESYQPSPLKSVIINELLIHPGSIVAPFVELYNHSSDAVDVSGGVLTDGLAPVGQFVLPGGTIIPGGGHLSISESDLGFILNPQGGVIYFKNSDLSSVIDAVEFDAQKADVSSGRFPDGSAEFHSMSHPTPGTSNDAPIASSIVINEIMYKPLSGDPNDAYIELYNQGTLAVDLTGWSFVSGISFVFPFNTIIGPDAYLVVAKNLTNLLSHYPDLNVSNTLGNFGGKLSGGGERVALAMPDSYRITNSNGGVASTQIATVVDEVTYGVGGRWGQWANGGGSSLELIDSRSAHWLAANWADSDETSKSAWTNIETTAVLDLGGNFEAGINHIQLGLLDVGECLVDNVEVIPAGTIANYVSNPGFEAGISGWTLQGDHVQSSIEAGGFSGARSIHLRCTDRIWTGANSVQGTLTNTSLAPSQTIAMRFKARWLRGWPEALLRLNGNWAEATGRLPVPLNLGTPGRRNSRAITNAPPAISAVSHSPALPAANQNVVVTARVHDPDGVQTFVLNYRIDPSTSFTSVPMRDDGTGGDAIPGDGIYSATIPGKPSRTMVAFYLSAEDSRLASSKFPSVLADNSPARECLVMFGDAVSRGGFGTYHLWLSQQTINRWSALPDLSNEMFDGTFVYGNRVVYNISARYAGSPYHQQFNSPIGNLCHYKWVFPDDDKFLGVTSFNKIHQPGNGPGDDDSIQREQTAYWMARKLGLPWNYRRYVAVYVNGNRRGTLMEDAQTPDADLVKEHFPADADGYLYKLQPWFEFDPVGNGFNNISWCTLNSYTTSGGVKKLARYRWNYLNRRSPDSANNYTNVFNLIDAANSFRSSGYVANMNSIVDMDEWLRIFAVEHAVGNWDSFGAQNAQNMYGYKPVNGRWTLFIWDYNIVLGNSGSWGPDGGNLFSYNGSDPVMGQIYTNPEFRRKYLNAFKDLANGPMVNANVDPLLDAKFAAFVASGVTVSSPAAIKQWILTMHSSLLTTLTNEGANDPFGISSTFTNGNLLTITGSAPVEVGTITVNGMPVQVEWLSTSAWSTSYALQAGSNILAIGALDTKGGLIGTAALQAEYNGSVDPPNGHVVINEIMSNAVVPGANYLELFNNSTTTAFNLSKWRVDGLDFSFGDGTILKPGAYLLVVQDRVACEIAYGPNLPIAGEWAGMLAPAGASLVLVKPGRTDTEDVEVAAVTCDNVPPWPQISTGSGVSLQLVDSFQPNDRVANWAIERTNSFETSPQWQYVTLTGTATKSIILIGMATAGDVYIDDLKLVSGSVPEAGTNMITNGEFETSLTDAWTVSANMIGSTIDSQSVHSGHSSLHVTASSGGPTIASAIWQNTATLVTNSTYTLSYWYLPSSNGTALLIRLSGSSPNSGHIYSLQSFLPRPQTSSIATPGLVNSVKATQTPLSPLWLNEIEPDNSTGLADTLGNRTPWVEIFNPTTNAVALGGLYLSTNYQNLLQWAFPRQASIGPGEFRTVWLDGNVSATSATEIHSGVRVAAGTGSLALAEAIFGRPRIVDFINYRLVGTDYSFGSFPDGSSKPRDILYRPSPGSPNLKAPPPQQVFINEWMASNSHTIRNPADGSFSDWFELYNAGVTDFDLGGFYLSNSATNKTQFQIPVGKIIPSRGFLLVWADKNSKFNQSMADLHTNFRLSKSGAVIALFTPQGTLVDGVSLGVQTADISQGRSPDGGTGSFGLFPIPTPGGANIPDFTPEIKLSAEARPDGIVLEWNSVPGRTYQLQSKGSLTDPAWLPVSFTTASSTVITVTNLSAGSAQFLRVQLLSR